MSDTVDAIGYRADVKTRAKDSIVEKKDAVVGKAGDLVDKVTGAVPSPGFVPGREDVKSGAHQAKQLGKRGVSVAQSNPIGLAIGAVAVGFLVGTALPSTTTEDERMGELADDVKERAAVVGREAVDRGKAVAQDVADTAKDAVQEAAQSVSETAQERVGAQSEELASTLREQAQTSSGS
jgi:hypothetical protein